jgi:ribosomal-protein-alanine N-acetyltransferase
MLDLPILTTERLLLRVFGPDEVDRVVAYYVENNDHFSPWDAPKTAAYFTPEYWRPILERDLTNWESGASARFSMSLRDDPDGDLIGNIAIANIVRGALHTGIIGYAIDHRYEGQGLMSEAAREVIRFGFEDLNLHRIEAGYMPTNDRSAQVLKRLGFEPYGYARDYLRVGERGWEDHVLVHKINREWTPKEDED